MWAKGKEPGICGNVVWRALRRMRPAGMVFWNAAFKGGIRIIWLCSTELAEKVSCSTCYFGRQQLCCLSIEGEACPTVRPCEGRGASSMGSPRSAREGWGIASSHRGYDVPVSYTHLRAHETKANLVCRL